MKRRMLLVPGAIVFALVSLSLTGCRTPSNTSVISNEQEKTIGDWAAAQIQSESMVPTDPAITTKVTDITQRLNAVLPTKMVPRIVISDSDSYQLASLPGGWVVISAKMVTLFAQQPDALAGLLAHEYAHVENGDSMKQMTSALGAETLLNMTTQGKYRDASNVAVQLLNFSHDTDDEYNADPEGVRLASAAGYDAHGLLAAIAVLKQVDTTETDPIWLTVHPVTSKRIRLLANEVAAYKTTSSKESSGASK